MLYQFLLPLHSLFRWLVLVSLLVAIVMAYRGRRKGIFSAWDERIRMITVSIVHIQFSIGVTLYFLSPMVEYFLNNFKDAVHMRQVRFFGMEHITMMVIAVAVITIGAGKIKRIADPYDKHKTMLTWFGIGLLIIFFSIPWSFSPFTSRPIFRPFVF